MTGTGQPSRRQVAMGLFDAWADQANIGAGHARYHLRYTFLNCVEPERHTLSRTPEEWRQHLREKVHAWVSPKFQDAYLGQLEHLIESALKS